MMYCFQSGVVPEGVRLIEVEAARPQGVFYFELWRFELPLSPLRRGARNAPSHPLHQVILLGLW